MLSFAYGIREELCTWEDGVLFNTLVGRIRLHLEHAYHQEVINQVFPILRTIKKEVAKGR